MPRFRRLRLLASLISLLFLAATTGYAAHQHEDADQSQAAEHCDLCLQLGAAAGAPVPIVAVLTWIAPGYLLPPCARGVIPGRRFLHTLQARGPPESLHG
jgi:hypothetical protein